MTGFVSVFTKINAGIWMLLIILSVLTAIALRFHHYPEGKFKTTFNYTNFASD